MTSPWFIFIFVHLTLLTHQVWHLPPYTKFLPEVFPKRKMGITSLCILRIQPEFWCFAYFYNPKANEARDNKQEAL